MEATMHEAKTQLSKLVERAMAGEEVILTRGRKRAPVVRLVPVGPVTERKRPIGLYKGQIEIGPEFFEPLPEEELAPWEGGRDEAAVDRK